MEIQLYNSNSIIPFTTNDLSIIKAIESELVNVVPDEILKGRLLELVHNSHLTAGIKPPDNKIELNITLNEIISEQRNNKSNLRFDEIEIAFKNGIHKKYGEYYGLNAVTFCFFIREYLKESARLEAIKIKNTIEVKKDPTEEEIYQLSVSNCIQSENEFKSKGTVGRFGVVVYEFLEKQKILVLDTPAKKEYFEQAKTDLQNYIHSKKSVSLDKFEIRDLNSTLQSLINNDGNKTTYEKLVVISKRLAVDDYFRSLELDELTIDKVLNAK